jgi:ABC-2 type transport system ATP-binding protein
MGADARRAPVSAALSVRGIGKSYGDLAALREISFESSAGEVLAIVGPNGAGKTTLLSIIAGTQRASRGTIVIGGDELAHPGDSRPDEHDHPGDSRPDEPEHPRDSRSPERSRGRGRAARRTRRGAVGWAPQQAALYARLTVAENLELFARLERVPDADAVVQRMLEQTGLRARAHERVARLSGGNRQRVNVALALLADPLVVALDEPSASLDPAQRERLWKFIKALAREGRSVVFSSHNMAEVQRHADRVLVLDRGEERFEGAPGELIRAAGGGETGDLESALVAFGERVEREREALGGAEPTG